VPGGDRWKQGGTGLGLALVQKLAAHLGGSIHLASAAHQTCFTVELPVILENHQAVTASMSLNEPQGAKVKLEAVASVDSPTIFDGRVL